jgi:hypothetical protein
MEAVSASEILCFNYKPTLDRPESKKGRFFQNIIIRSHSTIELKEMRCVVNYTGTSCDDVNWIKVAQYFVQRWALLVIEHSGSRNCLMVNEVKRVLRSRYCI